MIHIHNDPEINFENKIFTDTDFISTEEFEEIIKQNFYLANNSANTTVKGAGSFCHFVNHNGKSYALLTRRAEKLVGTMIKNIMQIINGRNLPVPIVGAATNLDQNQNYMMLLPKIEGINMPSYVYAISKNLSLASACSAMPQSTIDELAKECVFLNEKCIAIDFHGGNFLFQEDSGKVRMLDLKKRGQYPTADLPYRFLRLVAYNKIPSLADHNLLCRLRDEKGVDINFLTAEALIKAYIALSKQGYTEEQLAKAIQKLYGQNKDISDIEQQRF